ncbi:MAG TPA: 50S ribosomal protein L39e [Candidatus Nanopusillus sp.]|nr:50S ribosomal protein L39e [Candidatus Nanopusillus sp.]HIP89962.1 50S ribosomal protein L39e [Candidatus Nanopusillus sp.]
MAKAKIFGRKIRYAKKLRERWSLPLWIVIKKFGRFVHPYRIKVKRDWKHKKIKL